MYCPNCGKKNDIDALFCENCGARLIIPASSAQPTPASAVSSATQSTSSTAASEAPSASTSISAAPTAPEPGTRSAQHARQNAQPRSTSKLSWVILIVVLAVALGGGYYWLGHQRQSNSTATTTAKSSSRTATSEKAESSSSSKASASTATQTALWSTTKSSELASFMSSWQDTMNQSYEGTYDGQSVTIGELNLPSDIKNNQYQDKITVNGDAVKLKWTTAADTDAKYQVVAAATDPNASSGVITYLYVFHNGSPDVLVSQDSATATTFNFTSSQNTDLQDGFAKIANAD
ncbi:zinc ribbon domain-containing protein [Lactiplantibacillus plantarum]